MSEDEAVSHVGYFTVPEWTWRDKVRAKLFPAGWGHIDIPDLTPTKSADCIITRVELRWNLIDRLRLLLVGRTQVEVKTATENVVGKCEAAVAGWVLPPKWMDRDER